jgi:adenine-specific DNA-methyltransferase
VRRFSAKEEPRRLIAAVLRAGVLPGPSLGLENHLNFIHRPGGCLNDEEAFGLAVLLNSWLVDAYFRLSNGNTQVSATELRALPLPPPLVLGSLGACARAAPDRGVDALVEVLLLHSARSSACCGPRQK